MLKVHQSDDVCVNQLKVLADSTRLSVVRLLMDGPKHVNELNDTIRVDQSLLSHHLKLLRDAGLVKANRDGKAVLYQLADKVHIKDEIISLGCCNLSFEK